MTIHEMQDLNRATIEYASTVIAPGMTLVELRKLCEEYMLSRGAIPFGIGMWALLFLPVIRPLYQYPVVNMIALQNYSETEWSKLSPEEKKRQLFLKQKNLLDTFFKKHAISQA